MSDTRTLPAVPRSSQLTWDTKATMSVPLLTWECFDTSLVQVAVTTRTGGVSTGRYASLNLGLHVGDDPDAVLENRVRAASSFGTTLDDCVFAEQVAGTGVARVDDEMRGRGARVPGDALPATDAVVTTTPGPVLVILVADCVPIVLHDPAAGVLAVVHAGWPGTVGGTTPAAVAAMTTAGAEPGRIVAGIGPAVSAETYQVGEDVAGAARAAFGSRSGEVLRPDGTGRYLFDLVGAARQQLADCGVAASRIHCSGMVTDTGTPFFSHRAAQPCGRFAVMARLVGGVTA